MKTIIKFIKEAILELSKVTWPTRKQVMRMTISVIIVSTVFALFIGLVDIGLTKGVARLLEFIAQHQAISNQTTPIQVQPGDIQVETNSTP